MHMPGGFRRQLECLVERSQRAQPVAARVPLVNRFVLPRLITILAVIRPTGVQAQIRVAKLILGVKYAGPSSSEQIG
jgi:hypothetical protein